MRKLLPTSRQVLLAITLFALWAVVFILFSAVPGDLFYFPKALIINPRLTSAQKLEDLWTGYVRMQENDNCKKSVLIEQEILREIGTSRSNKEQVLSQFGNWQLPTKVSCNSALPFRELKLLANIADKGTTTTLQNVMKLADLRQKTLATVELSRHSGFKSQRALNSFTELALDLQKNLPRLSHKTDPLTIYEQELKLVSMQNILESNNVVAANYQQLFLASCLFSPEYDVCQSADKFNAKWNSVGTVGSPLEQLRLGRSLLNEVLIYQGLFTNNQ